MSKKVLYTLEYPVRCSPSILYEFLSTPAGLQEWFADNVKISPEKVYTFVWDHEEHKAVMAAHRINHFVKFEYLPETPEDKKSPSYFELRLEQDELTQATYIKISDYSDFDDLDELKDLWDGLIENLKTVVGG